MSDTPAAQPAVASPPSKALRFDISGIDLTKLVYDRKQLEAVNPHRHEMALLDGICYAQQDFKRGVAVWHVKDNEFWVRGHFPSKALVPGVLQVEAGAQLGVFMYNLRYPIPRIIAFTHIEHCSFRTPVQPGDTLVLLCEEIKFTPRRFNSWIQGVVNGKIAFDAEIAGMALGNA